MRSPPRQVPCPAAPASRADRHRHRIRQGRGRQDLARDHAGARARPARRRVLLFDGDLGLANVDVQLGPRAGTTTSRACSRDARLSRRRNAALEPGGFDIVAGRSGCGRFAAVPAAPLRNACATPSWRPGERATTRHPRPRGRRRAHGARVLAPPPRSCIVVATDEPTALDRRLRASSRSPGRRPRRSGRGHRRQHGGARRATARRPMARCSAGLRAVPQPPPRLLGVVRRDPKVREAIRHQTSLLTRFPNCAAAADVEAIASRLAAS